MPHACFLETLQWVLSAETPDHSRVFARAVLPSLLAFGSATPDNWRALGQLTYDDWPGDDRFELRSRTTGTPFWQLIVAADLRARRPAGMPEVAADAWATAVDAVVRLLALTGTATHEPRSPLPPMTTLPELAATLSERLGGPGIVRHGACEPLEPTSPDHGLAVRLGDHWRALSDVAHLMERAPPPAKSPELDAALRAATLVTLALDPS